MSAAARSYAVRAGAQAHLRANGLYVAHGDLKVSERTGVRIVQAGGAAGWTLAETCTQPVERIEIAANGVLTLCVESMRVAPKLRIICAGTLRFENTAAQQHASYAACHISVTVRGGGRVEALTPQPVRVARLEAEREHDCVASSRIAGIEARHVNLALGDNTRCHINVACSAPPSDPPVLDHDVVVSPDVVMTHRVGFRACLDNVVVTRPDGNTELNPRCLTCRGTCGSRAPARAPSPRTPPQPPRTLPQEPPRMQARTLPRAQPHTQVVRDPHANFVLHDVARAANEAGLPRVTASEIASASASASNTISSTSPRFNWFMNGASERRHERERESRRTIRQDAQRSFMRSIAQSDASGRTLVPPFSFGQLLPMFLGASRPRVAPPVSVPAANNDGAFPITDLDVEPEAESQCCICLEDGVVNTTISPCGHSVVCRGCAVQMRDSDKTLCPLCNVRIERVLPHILNRKTPAATTTTTSAPTPAFSSAKRRPSEAAAAAAAAAEKRARAEAAANDSDASDAGGGGGGGGGGESDADSAANVDSDYEPAVESLARAPRLTYAEMCIAEDEALARRLQAEEAAGIDPSMEMLFNGRWALE